MPHAIYDTLEWEVARAQALARDGHRCSLGRLFGGRCSLTLHVHHLIPIEEGGQPYDLDNLLTACATHHPMLEAMRRHVLRVRAIELPPCPHNHPYRAGREACERRRRQQVGILEAA